MFLKLAATVVSCSLVLAAVSAVGQDAPSYAVDRQQALELYKAGKLEQALPLLEKLAAENPADAAVLEALGVAAISRNASEPDPGKRKAWCDKGRDALLKAKQLGDESSLLQNVLSGIPANCENQSFSSEKEADAVMRSAEAAFSRGDYDTALHGYEQALLLDPKLYPAAVFAGDVYFRKGEQGSAGEWYARAIEINPNLETAYRYWGDALMAQGRSAGAREKYIDAIVAEPYERRSWTGIVKWAQHEHVSLNRLVITPPGSFQVKENGNADIKIDPASLDGENGGSAWIIYPITRVAWRDKTFAEKFPGQQYRHTLQEEVEALENVATSASQMLKDKKVKELDPQLKTLLDLKEKRLIAAYVLLGAADSGIAQDYAAYRDHDRDRLHQYLSTYVVPPAP